MIHPTVIKSIDITFHILSSLLDDIPEWLETPDLDNIRSLQRLSFLILYMLPICHSSQPREGIFMSQEDIAKCETRIRNLKSLLGMAFRLLAVYETDIPTTNN